MSETENPQKIIILQEIEDERERLKQNGLPPWVLNNFFIQLYENVQRQSIEAHNPKRKEIRELVEKEVEKLGLGKEVKELLQISLRTFRETGTAEDFKFTTEQRMKAANDLDELLVPVYVNLRLMGYSRSDLTK
jgi:hypothetical protein